MSDLAKVFIFIYFVFAIGLAIMYGTDAYKAKQGLEECPMDPYDHFHKTIWVKNCSEYLSNFEKAIGDKK
jgi:hypothetical protein